MSHVLQPVSELVSAGVPVRRAGAVSVAEEAAVAAAEAIAAEAAAGIARAATVAAAEAAVRARQTAEVAAAIAAKATAELAVKIDAGADLDVMAEAAAAEAVADAASTSAARTAAEARRTVAQAIAAEAAAAAVAEAAATASATVIAASTAAAAAAVRARHTIEVAAKFAAEAAAAVVAEAATAAGATLDAASATAEATLEAASTTAEATLEAASTTAEATLEAASTTAEATLDAASATAAATLDAASATAEATLEAAATTSARVPATAGHTAAEAGGTTMGNELDTEPDRRGPDDGAHEAVNTEWAVLLGNSSHGQVLLGPFRHGVSMASPAEQWLWRDISLARRIEAVLRAEEEEFEAVFSSAPAAMLVVSVVDDQPARFLRVNPALSRLTGYPLPTLLDLGLDDLAHPDQPTVGEGSRNPVRRDGAEPYELVQRWVHADGHDMWVRIRMAPKGTADGQEDRGVCPDEDVTGWATGARSRGSRVRAWWGHAGRPPPGCRWTRSRKGCGSWSPGRLDRIQPRAGRHCPGPPPCRGPRRTDRAGQPQGVLRPPHRARVDSRRR